MKRSYFAILAIIVLALMQACSRKSGPPYTPAEEQQTFRLPSGFRMELVAAEPDVIDPVAMTFDEAGRIYAVEMRDYPMGDGPPGRIRLLEDRDGDGRYEHSTVFADNLQLPNGVMRWRKGILVTSTPDILYFEDSDGDGKADKRKVVLTGFASQNPQLRLNGPQYGIDNWIYAAYTRLTTARRYAKEFGDKGQPIRFPDRPDIKPLDIHSRDVRFRPDEGKLEALAGFSSSAGASTNGPTASSSGTATTSATSRSTAPQWTAIRTSPSRCRCTPPPTTKRRPLCIRSPKIPATSTIRRSDTSPRRAD